MKKFLGLAVLSFCLSGCGDVDRAMYQTSNVVSSVDRVTGERSLNMTPREQQIRKGNQLADEFLEKTFIDKNLPINEKLDSVAYNRILKIFNRVHSVSHLSDEKWNVYLVPDNDFNAFTTGGTKIVVFKGLLDKTENDSEIAAVLGHEIAHVAANHTFERQANALAEMIKSSKVVKRKSYQSAFTLPNEEEADAVGTLYATLAGYDPYAASDIWKRMYEEQGNLSLFGIDHPMNKERFEKTKKLADQYVQYYIEGKINPGHEKILAQVFKKGSSSQLKPGEGAGFASLLDAAVDGFSKYQMAKLEEKRQKIQIKMDQNVQSSLIWFAYKLIDNDKVEAQGNYLGGGGISSLSLYAVSGKSMAVVNYDAPIKHNDFIKVVFDFKGQDISKTYNGKIDIHVAHAE